MIPEYSRFFVRHPPQFSPPNEQVLECKQYFGAWTSRTSLWRRTCARRSAHRSLVSFFYPPAADERRRSVQDSQSWRGAPWARLVRHPLNNQEWWAAPGLLRFISKIRCNKQQLCERN